MCTINFFTPVVYAEPEKNFLLAKVDDYFYLGGKKAYVIEESGNEESVILWDSKSSMLSTVGKIISYCTVIIPMIMLVAKAILRSKHHFVAVNLNQKLENEIKFDVFHKIIYMSRHFNIKTSEEKKLYIEIAKLAVARCPHTWGATAIANGGFDAKTAEGRTALLEIAKAALNVGNTLSIEDYGFDAKTAEGRAALLEIAKIAAAQNVWISCDISKYGFDAKTAEGRAALLEIAKIAAAHNGSFLSERIANYGFDAKTPEGLAALLEIARIVSARDHSDISFHIANYGFDAKTQEGRAALLEIAKTVATAGNTDISEYIGHYGFDAKTPEGRAALLEIAKICADRCKLGFLKPIAYIEKYGFDPKTSEGRKALLEIAKISAARFGELTSCHIESYGFDAKTPEGRAALLEIAKIAAAQSGSGVSININRYGFDSNTPEGKAALFEIAKIAAAQSGKGIAEYVHFYGFGSYTQEGRAALLEIAKIAVTQDAYGFSVYFKNFLFYADSPEEKALIFEIAKFAAAQNGAAVSCCIENYDFDAETAEGRAALFEVAKIAAAQNGIGTAQYIENYRFDAKTPEGRVALLEIAKIAIRESPYKQTATNMGKAISFPGLNLFEKCEDLDGFKLEIETNCKDLPLISRLFSEVLKFKDGHAKLQTLPLIASIHFLLATSDNKDIINHIPKWETTFIELIKTRDPALRSQLVDQLFTLLEKNPKNEVQGLLKATLQSLYAKKEVLAPEKSVLEAISKKDLKDATLQKTLLWVFLQLSRDINVSGPAAQRALEKAVKKNSRTEILNELRKIRAILNLKGGKQLEKQQDLNVVLQKLVQKSFPSLTEGIPHFGDALSRTFLTSRNPNALFTYAARLATLPGNPLAAPLSRFFKSVLNGTFKETREASESNPHLRQLKEKHTKVMEAWFKGDKILDYKMGKKVEEVVIPVRMILINALVRDTHFPDVDPLVLAVLNGLKGRDEAMKEIIAKLKVKETSKDKQDAQAVTRDLIRLLDPELKEEQRKAVVDQLIRKLPKGVELINDLPSLLPKKAIALETVTLSDTDDPYEILFCGSEVDGSCQRVDGNPSLNQGLLGYLLNGQTRLLTLKRGDSADIPMTARAIVRLQFNVEGKPVMLMERIYPQAVSLEIKEALIDFAFKRATALGVDLVSVTDGDTNGFYPGAIKNLGGGVPEYVDSAHGIQKGSYEINAVKRICR